ncbi:MULTISPECIES: hypothetical protein [Rhizobium]|uniref:hypothetical protein n=1 Tax=Rhizobium TaxID=379 RepID=UPI001C9193AD|nr:MULTISPECIES: hypothetical protein [Rhizobium]MBY3271369.1 hypothetical protein [Rhizobium laguerreae]MBY5740984.1 hypothetical protein [Rhizobium leguminosarum]
MICWAEAIAFEPMDDGQPSEATVIEHIRNAVIAGGLTPRGRITSGLREAYRPLRIDDSALTALIDRSLDFLTRTGDFVELATASGRAYSASPARIVRIDETRAVLLGAARSENFSGVVRVGLPDAAIAEPVAMTTLAAEIRIADWRVSLIELGGCDAPGGGSANLYEFTKALASSGETFQMSDADIAVMSGAGDFFGSFDKPLTGRWQPPGAVGCYPAIFRKPYATDFILLNFDGDQASFWRPQTRDLWQWVVVGHVLSLGQPIVRFDSGKGTARFLVPLPRQLHRVMLLSGEQTAAWNWTVGEAALGLLSRLAGTTS